MAASVQNPTVDLPDEPEVGLPPLLHRLTARGIGTVVVTSALVLLVFWGSVFAHHHGNFGGFVYFGSYFEQAIHPPRDAPITSVYGYDGQYMWRMAVSPLLGDHQVLTALAGNEYRAQRVLYPTLAWLLAGGRAALVPFALQLLGWASVLGLVALMSLTAVRNGRSAWWGLPLGLLPGMYLGLLRDVADPMAVTLMVGTLVVIDRQRWWLATLAMTAAVLTRESMMVLPVALVASVVVSRMDLPAHLKAVGLPSKALIAPALAAAAFALWELYAGSRLGHSPITATPDQQLTGPFNAIVAQLHVTARDVGNGGRFVLLGLANPLYLGAICVGAVLAVWTATRRLDPAAICAALFALVAVTQTYGDHWSYTRATAPMFAALAYVALQRRYNRTLIMIASGALLLPLYPA